MNEDKSNGQSKQAQPVSELSYGRAELNRQRNRSVWPWVIIALVTIALVVGIWFLARRNQSQSAKPGGGGRHGGGGGDIPVVAVEARKGDMTIYLDGLGKVQAYNTVTVRTRVDGALDKVAFTEGQIVHEGDLLAEIDPRPYQAALDTAKGQLVKDQATLEGAQNDLKIYQSISAAAMPRQQLEDQQATVHQLQGAVQSDQAQVESASVNLDYCSIKTPFTGRIGLRQVDQGNIVHAADTTGIATITELQPIAVIFSLREDDLPQIEKQINSGRTLVVNAFDRTMTTELAKGELLTTDNLIDPTTGTIAIKAKFENEDNSLFPNQFVNARLEIEILRGAVLIPSAAVQRSPDNSAFVYVATMEPEEGASKGKAGGPPPGVVHMRSVQLGPVSNDQTSIESGLSAGDIVVTDGVDKLQDGTKVTVKMTSADTGAATRPGGTTRPSRSARGGRGKASPTTTLSAPTEKP